MTDPLAHAVRDAVADAVDMAYWGVVDLDVLTTSLRSAGVTGARADTAALDVTVLRIALIAIEREGVRAFANGQDERMWAGDLARAAVALRDAIREALDERDRQSATMDADTEAAERQAFLDALPDDLAAPRVADECVGCLAESDEPHQPGCRYATPDPLVAAVIGAMPNHRWRLDIHGDYDTGWNATAASWLVAGDGFREWTTPARRWGEMNDHPTLEAALLALRADLEATDD